MIHSTISLREDRPDVTLSTYLVNDSLEIAPGVRRPGILICPGGGYMFCSDREAEPVALRFAAMGYHAFVLRYSTYKHGEGGMEPPAGGMEVREDSIHPAPMLDIGRAMRLLRDRADEWFLDAEKIVLCGFSAGAHNSAMFAVHWQQSMFVDQLGGRAEDYRPAAAILGYGLYDYRLNDQGPQDPALHEMRKAFSIAFTGSARPSEELARELSPVLHVSQSTPPMFLWATAEDDLVPAEHSAMMAAALGRAGIPYELHIFEKGMHGLSLADPSCANSRMQINHRVRQWPGSAEAWLETRFLRDLPDKPPWMTDET